jgi:hypothetical protein
VRRFQLKCHRPVPRESCNLSFPDELLPILELAGYRNSFASVATGITELIEANKMLLRLTGGPKWALQPDVTTFSQVRNWSEDILRMLKEHDPVRQILMVNQDVLGSYSYAPRNTDPKVANQASIQLYWTVIGLVAKDLGCEVEDLTVVVMVHELAHAYTQLGADIGGCAGLLPNSQKQNTKLKRDWLSISRPGC